MSSPAGRAPTPATPPSTDAVLLAMATLGGVGPARLAVLSGLGDPRHTWSQLVAAASDRRTIGALVNALEGMGGTPQARERLVGGWATSAAALDVVELEERHRRAGVQLWRRGVAPYPTDAFATEAVPPALLLAVGNPASLQGARVAIVGTRSCTRYGSEVAAELAGVLADAGVVVVSGLAAGVDAAAHRAALGVEGSTPVGVVASGPDVIYPRVNAPLWRQVVARGLLLTEAPLGTRPEPWRFPQRNRIIAALADVVVVVESHRRGGAVITARHAMDQGRTVLAVPGPVRSPASAGCHDLIADGTGICQGPDDVLVALGMTPGARRPSVERRPAPVGTAAVVLGALGWSPSNLATLVEVTGLGVGEVVSALAWLGEAGWVVQRGGWFEQASLTEGGMG